MDWLGSALGGSRQEAARLVVSLIREEGGNFQSTVIGFNEKTAVSRAALANGASSHILELDDLHKGSILHPAAPIISAAAAISEMERSGGKDLITAVVAGYEVGIRIAEAITPSHYYYWHTTGTCGTFGAAAAAASIVSLSVEETVHALGNAGSQAAGLWEFLKDGAMTKHLHSGKAAMNGIIAVQLARKGFTGAKKILEGEKGFFKATATEIMAEKAIQGLGEEYRILDNSYKIYPSCGHTHGAVDLAIKLAGEGLQPADIARIKVKTYGAAKDLVGNSDPTSPYEAKFSLPFCLSSALVYKKLILESFRPEALNDPLIRALIDRCQVEEDAQITARYPAKWPIQLEIILNNGRVLLEETDYPRGDPENPASEEDLRMKFQSLAALVLNDSGVQEVLNKLESLEDIQHTSSILYQNPGNLRSDSSG